MLALKPLALALATLSEVVVKTLKVSAIALVALAGDPAEARKAEITLHQPGTINGVAVEKGTYRIDVPDTEGTLTVFKGKEIVAKAPCRVEPLQESASGDSIVFRTGTAGEREVSRIILLDPKIVIHVSGPVQAAQATPKEPQPAPAERPADSSKS